LTWLRIIHSGDWCLCLALCTPSAACYKRRRIKTKCLLWLYVCSSAEEVTGNLSVWGAGLWQNPQ